MTNNEFIARFAAGETDEGPPAPGGTGEGAAMAAGAAGDGASTDGASTDGLWPDEERDRTSEPAQIEHDKLETPGAEPEIQAKQDDPVPDAVEADPDIDESRIRAVPGTGGPDDVGDVEVDPSELNLPGTGHS